MPALKAIFSGDAAQLEKQFAKIEHAATHAGEHLRREFGSKLTGLLGVAAIEETGRRIIEYSEQVTKLSSELGISVESVQAWDHALKLNGTTLEQNATFFNHLAVSRKKALEGDAGAVNSFRQLGVTLKDLRDSRLEDVALKIARVFEAGDAQRLVADLREVGGRGSTEMVEAFRSGLGQMIDDARAAGIIISAEVIGQLTDAGESIKGLGQEIIAGLAPVEAWLAQFFEKSYRGFNLMARYAETFAVVFASALRRTHSPSAAYQEAKGSALKSTDEKLKEYQAVDAAREKRRQSRTGTGAGGDDRIDKARSHAELRDRERLQKLEDDEFLRHMSGPDRIRELQDRKQKADAMAADPDLLPGSRTKQKIYSQELQKQIEESAAGMHFETHRGHLTQYQHQGAYAAAPSTTLVDVQKKAERHLAAILQYVKKNGDKGNTRPPSEPLGGVNFG